MSSAATKHKPDHAEWKCVTCGKRHENASGFCSTWCVDAAQIKVWGVPMRDLPIKWRLPRLVPERLK